MRKVLTDWPLDPPSGKWECIFKPGGMLLSCAGTFHKYGRVVVFMPTFKVGKPIREGWREWDVDWDGFEMMEGGDGQEG